MTTIETWGSNTIDMNYELSSGFRKTKASNWQGATAFGSTLRFGDTGAATYTYDCGRGFTAVFTLVLEGSQVDLRVPGDADGNGETDFRDARLTLQYASGWNVGIDTDSADVNRDGYADLEDALLILQAFCGLDAELK